MSKAKKMIDELIEKKAKGNSFQILNIQMKLMLKGIKPEEINEETPDDPDLIQKIQEIAKQFNVELTNH